MVRDALRRAAAPEATRAARRTRAVLCCALAALIMGCVSTPPPSLGLNHGKLAACPPSPNCVCSDDDTHSIAPFKLVASPSEAWTALRKTISAQPRARVMVDETQYLRAEFRSLVFRFVDDVEFHLRADDGLIAVRSASRTGHSDFGVNRRRIESIRAQLRSQKVIE